jgi:Mor family transcriptional regulator
MAIKKERNKKIVEFIQTGSSYNELARLFNISPQRIQAIWNRERSRMAKEVRKEKEKI